MNTDLRATETNKMKKRSKTKLTICFSVLWLTLSSGLARALDTADTRLLSTPAITEGKLAFVYADDIWVADADGGHPRRLTSHPGQEQNPYFSPDGKHIAFTASYDGNVDAYAISTEGGEPNRLTWHPGDDIVQGFTPEGKVLFSSPRAGFTRGLARFYTVGLDGGAPQALPVPTADMGAVSSDGKFLAYTPLGERFRQWKNYRGGTASRIWILKLDDLSHEEIPKPASGCNDTQPMWIGKVVYFLSDRDGEFNLYSYDRHSKRVSRLTEHDAFPVASASAGAGKVIYEQAGWLYLYEPGETKSRRLKIGVAADLLESRSRYAAGTKNIRHVSISPSGKRVAIEYRGEIVTVPAKKGDARNLSQTPGAHERSPAWSPDGKSIAYFSDESGEYALVVHPQDGKAESRSYPLNGAGFYDRPTWSPDSKKIAFIDNARTLYWIDLGPGTIKRIAAEPIYGPVNTMQFNWSPDSRWLAYTLTNRAGFQTIQLYALEANRSHPVTDGLIETGEPVFDSNGKYLYFLGSTDAGPVKNWFDQSNADKEATVSIYLVTLAKATPNPLLRESDEESPASSEKGNDSKTTAAKDQDKSKETRKGEAVPETPVVVVDPEDISRRALALPVESGYIASLTAGNEGQIFYIRRTAVNRNRGPAGQGKPSLMRFDLKTREEEPLAESVNDFAIAADHKKMLYRSGELGAGGPFNGPVQEPLVLGIVDVGKFKKGDGALNLEAISVRIEPRAEWEQIFREAWRINRDYFYAPNMHGADWKAMRSKYEQLLPDVASRGDLNRVIRMMLSELSVGHSFLFGGDRLYEPKPVPVGLLGADYEIADGHYRFKTIYGGAYWDTSLRSPLSAPGVDVKPGEFLLAVNGKEIKTDSEVYRQFEGTAGKRVELKIGPNGDGTGVAHPHCRANR